MAIWDDVLTEKDRALLATRPPRKKTGFGERPALLIIDMDIGVCGEDKPIIEQLDVNSGTCGEFAWATIPNMKRVVTGSREAGVPVIFSNHIMRAIHGMPNYDNPTYSHSELSPLSALLPDLGFQEGDLLIEKQRPSVFFHTGLIYILLNKKIDSLIVVGNSTSGCVRASVIDASGYTFKVSVVGECVFDRLELSHKASLFDMAFKYCDVVSVDETLGFLSTLKDGQRVPALAS